MSRPRYIRKGRTIFVTRRTTRRSFLLRPDAAGKLNELYWYVTAVIAKKFGIRLHAVQVMSTHIHEVLTDVHGNLPAFVRERNRALANALKRYRGWSEEVFQRGPASYVELYGAEAIAEKIAYTIANCVEAGCVNDPADWPGVTVCVDDIGRRVMKAERPSVYFDPENPVWPATASIAIEMPDALLRAHGDRASNVLRHIVHVAVEEARKAAARDGRVVPPRSTLTTIPIETQSTRPEPRYSMNPAFATGGNADQLEIARAERKAFFAAYYRALSRLRRGAPPFRFPEGTWRWRRELFGAPAAGPKAARSVGKGDAQTPQRQRRRSVIGVPAIGSASARDRQTLPERPPAL